MLGSKAVIVDSDALIGLIHKDDLLHSRCLKISDFLKRNDFPIAVPYPIVLEAATTLARDKTIRRPDLAHKLLNDYARVEQVHLEVADVASFVARLYSPSTSKRNTPFDYYLLALAKRNNIRFIFSFDAFYPRNGLRLIEEML